MTEQFKVSRPTIRKNSISPWDFEDNYDVLSPLKRFKTQNPEDGSQILERPSYNLEVLVHNSKEMFEADKSKPSIFLIRRQFVQGSSPRDNIFGCSMNRTRHNDASNPLNRKLLRVDFPGSPKAGSTDEAPAAKETTSTQNSLECSNAWAEDQPKRRVSIAKVQNMALEMIGPLKLAPIRNCSLSNVGVDMGVPATCKYARRNWKSRVGTNYRLF